MGRLSLDPLGLPRRRPDPRRGAAALATGRSDPGTRARGDGGRRPRRDGGDARRSSSSPIGSAWSEARRPSQAVRVARAGVRAVRGRPLAAVRPAYDPSPARDRARVGRPRHGPRARDAEVAAARRTDRPGTGRPSGVRSAKATADRASAAIAGWPVGWSRPGSRWSWSRWRDGLRPAELGRPRPRPLRLLRRLRPAPPPGLRPGGSRGWSTTSRPAGLLDSTLVVATGEFGRTPWINESGGRDHWPGVWSALVAGGGARGGGSSGRATSTADPSTAPWPSPSWWRRWAGPRPRRRSEWARPARSPSCSAEVRRPRRIGGRAGWRSPRESSC